MGKLDDLKQRVAQVYRAKQAGRDRWCDWLYENHVLVVAATARRLAEKYKANVELAEIAALLHDIADITMARAADGHEAESLAIGRRLMAESGYSPEDIALVVDDAVRFHSCHGSERPKSQEGLILATADALAHFQTDFYLFATRNFNPSMSLADIKAWSLKKIDRDLFNKISFDDERAEAQKEYDLFKELFSR